jgi:hypothetical protein
MMMVAVTDHGESKTEIYLSLPQSVYLRLFDGFEEIEDSTLPERATLLVANNADFEERFKYDNRP